MNGGVPSSSAGRQYDMHVERDVIALLQVVRVSTLDPESKDIIRDLIFGLHTGSDQALLDELQMYVSPLGVVIAGTGKTNTVESAPDASVAEAVAPSKAGATATTNPLGNTRPKPAFGSSTTASVASPSTPPPAPTAPVIDTPAPAATVPQTPVEPVSDTAEVPITTKAPENTPAQPPAAAEVEQAAPAATSPDEALLRIKAIKAAVNAAVGNPVNLIDATNEVGREYMNALLEAMKAVGGEGAVEATMARLETAYAAVESTLEQKPAVKKEAPVETPEAPVNEPKAPTGGYAAVAANQASQPAPAHEPPTPPAQPEVPKPTEMGPSVPAGAATTKLTPLTAVTPPVSTAAAKAKEADVPPPVTDSLMSEAVNTGLQQLLAEWKLFKSSGLLGTGPKSDKHPLYQELRNLPMNLVIAGRFEGATPEVRQSITDYMNGWRYEQGMTHDMQETFEHYLRRVVKTIIDKQSK